MVPIGLLIALLCPSAANFPFSVELYRIVSFVKKFSDRVESTSVFKWDRGRATTPFCPLFKIKIEKTKKKLFCKTSKTLQQVKTNKLQKI